jgi:hypothetical protein
MSHSQSQSSHYALEFALDTLPSHALIDERYDIKVCLVHAATKGIGRRFTLFFLLINFSLSKATTFQIQAYHDRDGKHAARDLVPSSFLLSLLISSPP